MKVGAKKFFMSVRLTLSERQRASEAFLKDLRKEFITELIYPAVQANCIYEASLVAIIDRVPI